MTTNADPGSLRTGSGVRRPEVIAHRGSKSFPGNVYAKHVALTHTAAVGPEHFLRWITLWHRHTAGRFAEPVVQELRRTAEGIGRNLFFGMFGSFARFVFEDGVAVAYEPTPPLFCQPSKESLK